MNRFCGTKEESKRKTVKSDGNFFRVTFKSNDVYDATGFEAFYQFRKYVGKTRTFLVRFFCRFSSCGCQAGSEFAKEGNLVLHIVLSVKFKICSHSYTSFGCSVQEVPSAYQSEHCSGSFLLISQRRNLRPNTHCTAFMLWLCLRVAAASF